MCSDFATHRKRLSFASSAQLGRKRLRGRKLEKKSISDPEGFGLQVKISPVRGSIAHFCLQTHGNVCRSLHRRNLVQNARRGFFLLLVFK
jgi:hypothetical protein